MKPKAVPLRHPLRLQSFVAPAAVACCLAASVRANGAQSGVGAVRGRLVVRARREVWS
jgi:hypothetical protein